MILLGLMQFAMAQASEIAAPISDARPTVASTAQRLGAASFARCIARGDRVNSSALIRADPESPAEKAALIALNGTIRRCDARTARDGFAPGRPLLRGLLAEQLWNKNGGFVAVPSPPPVSDNVTFDVSYPVSDWLKARYAIADCIVYRAAGLTDRLLSAPVGSRAEADNLRLLGSELPHCVANGTTIGFDPTLLRAMLAEALFRRYPMPHDPASRADLILKP